MKTLDICLHIGPPIVLLSLIFILLRRQLHRDFRIFFLYMFYVPVATALQMAVMHRPAAYFWLYWSTEAGYGILALLVLREIFHRVFAVVYANYRWFRFLLPAIVIFSLGLSLWEVLQHPFGREDLPGVVNAIYWFDLGAHLVEGGVLLLLLALTAVLPIAWRRYEFGILAGFGLNASLTIIAYVLRFDLGRSCEVFFRYGPPIAYLFATLVWLRVFFRPPRSNCHPQMGLEEVERAILQFWTGLRQIKRAFGFRQVNTISPF